MRRVGLGGLFLVWLTLSACSEQTADDASLTAYVPKDSPYVFASGAPFPEAYIQRVSEFTRQYAPKMKEDIAVALVDSKLSAQSRDAIAELFARIYTQSDMSFDRPFVIYGRGLAPTMRLEIEKSEELSKIFDELDADEALPIESSEKNGRRYWRLGLDGWTAIASIHEGRLGMGVTTGGDEAALLDHLVSSPSGDAASIEKALDSVRERYGFSEHPVGYVDTAALVAAGNAGSNIDAACLEEIAGYTQIAPRLVAGYEDVSDSVITARGIIELEPSVAKEIAAWATSVPGLGGTDALFSFGLGLDLQKALTSAMSWQQQLAQRGSACGLSADAIDPTTMPGVMLMMGAAGNPKGLRVALDGIPSDLTAGTGWLFSALLLAESPQSTAALASQQLPMNALLASQGKPVELELPAIAQVSQPLWGMMTDNAIGFAVGDDGQQRVQAIVDAPAAPAGTLLGMEFDMGKIADLIQPQLAEGGMLRTMMLAQAASSGNADAAEVAEREIDRSIEALQLYGQLMSRVTVTLRATPAGIELYETIALR